MLIPLGGGVKHLEDTLEGQMSPTYSPIASMTNLGANVQVGDLYEQEVLNRGGFKIRHATFRCGPHDIVGFRIEEGGWSLCYVAEAEHPKGKPLEAVVELARGADVLIHEAYYTNEEFEGARVSLAGPAGPPASGHSCYAQATDVAASRAGSR